MKKLICIALAAFLLSLVPSVQAAGGHAARTHAKVGKQKHANKHANKHAKKHAQKKLSKKNARAAA
jgi:hypothetical protein